MTAGKDAGRAYNTYPDMDGRIVPPEYWDMSLRPLWRNTFENTAANQFHHRMMAATTAIATLAFWPWVRASAAPQVRVWAVQGLRVWWWGMMSPAVCGLPGSM